MHQTLDSLIEKKLMTPIAKKLELIFRNNTFIQVKEVKLYNNENEGYDISSDGKGYCSGTAFIYCKSIESNKKDLIQ